MCGRFVQYEGMAIFIEELSPQIELFSGYDAQPIDRYNVAPSTRVELLHAAEDGLHIDAVKWGWAPFWAKGKRPDPINARVETVTTGKFFKQLWPKGRALVPSEGWYEWIKDPDDPKRKQPYFIRLKSQKPMFFGALAQVHPGLVPQDGDGFVIITAASDQGMVDIHDRKPLVLTPEHAREWIEPGLTPGRAEEIAKECCQPVDDFEWFRVGTSVGNVRNQGAGLIIPILDSEQS
ncbi:SOS response-associated peptidase family protein [Pseudomonas fluorescens]|uniref:SOS response-associated peptidase family protein n=1 Tax=Pseudomonas fluorescens TaxID=294 RepID=UPI001784B021|nr:SOS response-associated peptidase family protein [Pseudomonas fluorescens]MBD8192119.1 SOS response-associated peptidase family protein [Pseudomonas fluorescens]MBD8226743.1 SOS response-associated peptidase family protein [Pseudomonas fluorescens]MBD8784456.1 SOS response-associated peptidase family protein [Pseudomonas fluorescens]MBD8817136.1 SOS response-associated peptidase family protein [Pseudomonas fluorescens]